MRKLALLLVAALLTALTLTPLTAQDSQPDIFALAALAPATDDVYATIRLDDAYIATLNDLTALVVGALKDIGAPMESVPRLQDLIGKQIDANATPAQVDAVLALLGDTIAISIDTVGVETDVFTVFAPITDQQAVLDALNATGAGIKGIATAGRFMIYESPANTAIHLLLADDLLILTGADAELIGGGDYAKLSESTNFVKAVTDLPAGSYNLALYATASAMSENNTSATVLEADFLLAATILDGKTLTIDTVAVPTTPAQPSQAVDPAFLRYIPSRSTAVIHATDLSNLLNNFISIAESQGNPETRAQLEQALSSVGLSLDGLLTWTKGDYATFARADVPALMQALVNQNVEAISPAVDFGVVIQATDPTLAKEFSDKIAGLLAAAVASQPGVVLSTKDIGGTSVTRIEINAPLGNGQTLNIALGLGANANVFAFGTFRAVETLLTDTSGLAANPLYAESAAYVLPGATSVWYTDGATLTTLAAVGGVGIAGSVGGALSGVQEGLRFGGQTAARAQTVQAGNDAALVMQAIDRASKLVRYTTASSSVSPNGSYVVRATLTLGE